MKKDTIKFVQYRNIVTLYKKRRYLLFAFYYLQKQQRDAIIWLQENKTELKRKQKESKKENINKTEKGKFTVICFRKNQKEENK